MILGFQSSIDLKIVKLVLNVSKIEENTCNSNNSMHAFNKTKEDDIISNYKDVFQGIGKLDGECHLHMKVDVVPIAYPARTIPSSLQGKLEAELNYREEQGITE